MTLGDLRQFGLIYLATVYSKHPEGLEVAFRHAAILASRLMLKEINVYSPICHTHPMAIHAGLNPLDHSIWLPFDEVIMKKADALLVAMMERWEDSVGIAHEIKRFTEMQKPIYYLDPVLLKIVEPE